MFVHPRLLLLNAALVCILAPVAGLPADPPPARDPKELAKIPPYQRLLQGEDAKRAAELDKMIEEFIASGKFRDAEDRIRKLLEIRSRVQGRDHHETMSTKRLLETIAQVAAWSSDKQTEFSAAIKLAAKADEDYRRGRYGQAESRYRQAADLFARLFGGDQIFTAENIHNVAYSFHAQGKYAEAERCYQKALTLYRRVLGQTHPDVFTVYNNLANTYNSLGEYATAEAIYRKVLAYRLQVLGDDHPFTAGSHHNLAFNLSFQGKHAEAEPIYRRALAIHEGLLGHDHPDTLSMMNNLAITLQAQGQHSAAESLCARVLAARRRILGNEHPLTADSCHNLAYCLSSQMRFREAEKLFEEASAGQRRLLGDSHPYLAHSYHNRAINFYAQGEYAAADPLFREALNLFSRVLGPEHPHTARSSMSLGMNLYAEAKYSGAERYLSSAADRSARARPHSAFEGLDRSAATVNVSPLPALVCVLARNNRSPEAWRRLEENLGRGLFDDLSARQARRLSPEERKRQQELTAKLERLDKLFANLPPTKEKSPERQKQLDDLKKQYSAAQAAYSEFEAEMARKYGPAAGHVYSITKIQERLPADTALLAWLDIKGQPKAADPNGEHWAFVLRHCGEPICVKLPGNWIERAWTKQEDELPGRVAKSYSERPGESIADQQKQIALLTEQRLTPIAKLLAGEGTHPRVKRLIVLPSPALANVPVETLLSDKEDITVSYAPSGTIFTWLREKARSDSAPSMLALADPAFAPVLAKKESPLPDHGVFIRVAQPGSPADKVGVRSGDVLLSYAGTKMAKVADLGAAIQQGVKSGAKDIPAALWRDGKTVEMKVPPGPLGIQVDQRPAGEAIRGERDFANLMRATRGQSFQPLPGTRREVEAISRTIKSKQNEAAVTELIGSEASEQRLDELNAKGELAKYRYIHLATHGVADRRFHLKSYLVLAQDKLPDPVEQVLAGKPAYDGKLTAEQIMRTWNLNADLVVLSACESGLGKFGGGEGYLGFSQALLLAGARSVVLSLWKVDDDATALLMTRFYQNLLKPMPNAEALSEAKKWLRSLTAKEVTERLSELPRGIPREKPAAPPSASPRPYEHPYYWAAFILIGDPD